MIDYFTLALTHGLMALALWRLMFRADLDEDGAQAPRQRKPWVKKARDPRGGGSDA